MVSFQILVNTFPLPQTCTVLVLPIDCTMTISGNILACYIFFSASKNDFVFNSFALELRGVSSGKECIFTNVMFWSESLSLIFLHGLVKLIK